MRVDTLVLANSAWAKFAQYGAKFSELYSAALRDAGMLCLAIYRRIEDTDAEEISETEDTGDEATEKVNDKHNLSRYLKVQLQGENIIMWENTRRKGKVLFVLSHIVKHQNQIISSFLI